MYIQYTCRGIKIYIIETELHPPQKSNLHFSEDKGPSKRKTKKWEITENAERGS